METNNGQGSYILATEVRGKHFSFCTYVSLLDATINWDIF